LIVNITLGTCLKKKSYLNGTLRFFLCGKKILFKDLTAENREGFHKEPQRNTDINLVHIP